MLEWSTACPDWERRIVAGESLVPCSPLFPAEAEAALRIFRDLTLVDVAGRPTMAQACRPWIFDFVSAIFGAYDAEAGRRLIRYFFLLISKKNNKSTTAAGIMVTALLRNWRASNEYFILAPTLEVAQNSFIPARDMIRADPELDALLHVQQNVRTITHRNTDATLRVIAADEKVVGGKKAAGVLVEELWLFGKKPKAEEMLREATGGLASRPEGFVAFLSTQSDEPPAGVFKQKLDEFRDIRDGKLVDPRSLGVLYEFPEHMIKSEAYKEPRNFYITNPNLGASVDEQYLLDKKKEAERAGSMQGFYAKHLNVEIGSRLRANRWPGAEHWEVRADASITRESILDRCEVVVIGIDGGGLDDLFGLTLLGREPALIEIKRIVRGTEIVTRMKRWLSWSHAWAYRGVLERRKSIATQLLQFEAANELTLVDDGDLQALADIADIVSEIKHRGRLGAVAVDPAGIGSFVDVMVDLDITQENKLLVGVGQGYRMMNAIKTAELRLAGGMLLHAKSSMMDWCVGNLKIEATATAIRATKQTAGDAKIDPAMALFDAVDIMSLNPQPSGGRSYLEDADELGLVG